MFQFIARTIKLICYSVVGLIILACALAVIFGKSSTPSSSSPAHTSLKPELKFDAAMSLGTVRITNRERFTTPVADVVLLVDRKRYQHVLPSLKPDDHFDLTLLNFTNDRGERFNPLTHKAQAFMVAVDGYRETCFKSY